MPLYMYIYSILKLNTILYCNNCRYRLQMQSLIIRPCCSKTLPLSFGDALISSYLLSRKNLKTNELSYRHFNATTNDCSNKPYNYHLEHIQKRLEYTVPMLFRYHLDYTFYCDDVLMEDHILNIERRGLDSIRRYFGIVSISGMIMFPLINATILNCVPLIDDGTVHLRWRIVYLTYLQFPAIIYHKSVNKVDLSEKRLKWYDGYSIFHVNGEGLVYKFTIQRVMPDLDNVSKIKEKTKKLVSKVVPAPNFQSTEPKQYKT